jgi:hypothetical protein
VPPTIPRKSFGADLGDAMCAYDVLIGQARTYLRPCRPELPFGVIEVGAAAPFIDGRTMSIALYRAALHSPS